MSPSRTASHKLRMACRVFSHLANSCGRLPAWSRELRKDVCSGSSASHFVSNLELRQLPRSEATCNALHPFGVVSCNRAPSSNRACSAVTLSVRAAQRKGEYPLSSLGFG